MNNIVDNRIRFQGRDICKNGCVKIGNVTLVKRGKEKPIHQYGRLEVNEEDKTVVYEPSNDGVLYFLDKDELKVIKETPGYSKIKKYVTRIR